MEARCEGLAGPLSERTFLAGTVGEWSAAAAPGVIAPPGVVWSSEAARQLPPGVRGTPKLTLLGPIAAVTGAPVWIARAPDVATADTLPEAWFDVSEREIPGMALPSGPVRIADAWAYPVGHWTQLLWANLLALGPFLWEVLVGRGPAALPRLAWAALRAVSVAPEDVAARLNRLGPGARVHRTATVEGCLLGRGARVGAGAVVRGAVLGDDAVVEELALVEGAVLGRGARVQRLGMAKFSVIEDHAAFAGIMQLGVVGKGAVVKHGAILMDMTLGQAVRVRVGERLEAAPHGLCGVCVGDGAVVAAGVRVAPGRVVPAGVEVLMDPGVILTHPQVDAGVRRAFVRDGRLVTA
jgi:acetyltransferase-like isoleucine patch superfamily enzyme